MAQEEVILKLTAEVGDMKKQLEEIQGGIKGIGDSTKNAEKGIGGMAKSFKGVGLAIKAAGIGILLAGLNMLKDLFMQNQKVADFFGTAMKSVSMVMNDFINFVVGNASNVTSIFKDIFENPSKHIKKLGDMIKDNLIERFNSLVDMLGHTGRAFKHLFAGEFAKAAEEAKGVGSEFVDVLTGVDNTLGKVSETVKEVGGAIKDYATNTYEAAAAQVQLANSAQLAAAQLTGLVEENDRLAETQRQIRDNENATFEERIAANNKLKEIITKQKEDMLVLADISIAAAQAEVDNLDNIENRVALQEAINEKKGVEAQITGFMSEQMTNAVGLENERLEAVNQVGLELTSERERELEEVRLHYAEQIKIAKKAGLDTIGLEKAKADSIMKIRQTQLNADLSATASMLSTAAGMHQEGTKGYKQLKIAETLISTYTSAQAAYASGVQAGGPLGPVVGAIFAAVAVAAGLQNVATIAATNVSMAQGGMVGGYGSGTSDSVNARLSKGETVINAKSTRMFKPLLSNINKAGGGIGFADGGTLDSGSAGMTGGVIKAFVVADELTTQQERVAKIRRKATI